jgi:hypothetical protein
MEKSRDEILIQPSIGKGFTIPHIKERDHGFLQYSQRRVTNYPGRKSTYDKTIN